jgi:hypothetical protein
MRTSLNLLDDIQIASPCPASWEGMRGNDRARHCASCDKTVYDLSRLTAEQAADLIRAKEGSLCVRLFRRSDGRVLTADCPVGLRERLQKLRDRWDGTLVGSLLGAFLLCLFGGLAWLGLGVGGGPFGGAVQGEVCPPPGLVNEEPDLLHHPREVEPALLHHPREVE